MSLAPCTSCSRHVKTTETSCPFCKADLGELKAAPLPFVKQRMTRAAAYALGASLVVAGCSGSTVSTGDGGTSDGGGPSGDGGGGRDGSSTDGPSDEGNIQPPYGAPLYGGLPVDGGDGGGS
jgi:hypothetical protein